MTSRNNRGALRAASDRFAKGLAFLAVILSYPLQLGLFFNTRHARDFSKAPPSPNGAADATVPVTAFCDPDEDQLFHDVMMSFAGDCLKNQRGEGQDEHFEDLHWGSTKGLIEGTLEISAPEKLPCECRVGLFKTEGTYPVVSRPNFLHNNSTIRVSRLSLKVQTDFDVPNVYNLDGQARELDLLLSEGVRQLETGDQDGQGFFFRDARQLRYMSWLQNHPYKAALSLLHSGNRAVARGHLKLMKSALDTLYSPQHFRKSWEEKDYYSAGPYSLNGTLVKFALRSRQKSHANDRLAGPDGPAHDQWKWFDAWSTKAAPAVFDVCVQVARFGAIPEPSRLQGDPCKAVMATEYTDMVWDENVSPFETVGQLTLHPAPVTSDPRPWYFQHRDRWYPQAEVPDYALRFNAWNTLPEMVPVGQLFRARKQVHAMHRDTRLRHTFDAVMDPMAMCPMSKMDARKKPAE